MSANCRTRSLQNRTASGFVISISSLLLVLKSSRFQHVDQVGSYVGHGQTLSLLISACSPAANRCSNADTAGAKLVSAACSMNGFGLLPGCCTRENTRPPKTAYWRIMASFLPRLRVLGIACG